MSEISARLVHGFRGETVVLLSMDDYGLDRFRSVLTQVGMSLSTLTHGRTVHEFAMKDGDSEIVLLDGWVKWLFAPSKLVEVIEKLDAMKEACGPCHQYVDISTPARVLVLSLNEYV